MTTTKQPSAESLPAEKPAIRTVSFKSVALPAEHGSWSLVSEPILLGLLVAPTLAGLAMAVSAFAVFLVNRPLKIYLADRRRGRSYERTALAGRFVLIFSAIALIAAAITLVLEGWWPFAPFILALPLLLIFMVYDQRPGRFWQAELTAPAAFAAVAAAIGLAGGMAWQPALGLWGFMVVRVVPTVIFVRARLRLDKGKEGGAGESAPATIAIHILGVVSVAALVRVGWLPWAAVLAALILLGRAIWGLSDYRWRASVQALGFLEVGFGVLSALIVTVGFWLN